MRAEGRQTPPPPYTLHLHGSTYKLYKTSKFGLRFIFIAGTRIQIWYRTRRRWIFTKQLSWIFDDDWNSHPDISSPYMDDGGLLLLTISDWPAVARDKRRDLTSSLNRQNMMSLNILENLEQMPKVLFSFILPTTRA